MEIISSSNSELIQQLVVVLMNIQTLALDFDVSFDNSLDPTSFQKVQR